MRNEEAAIAEEAEAEETRGNGDGVNVEIGLAREENP